MPAIASFNATHDPQSATNAGHFKQHRHNYSQSQSQSQNHQQPPAQQQPLNCQHQPMSAINLASLATVTNKFTCSASVGNLWHHGQHHASHQAHLADHSKAANGIQPLDYVTAPAFDSYQPDSAAAAAAAAVAKEPASMKASSSHKLLSVAGLSARKLSTKDKCKRQKDVERLEKLRLLVNYLKSGSSQPMVNPVALEADEIELAERYKLHMSLRDDLLQADKLAAGSGPGSGDSGRQQPTGQSASQPVSNAYPSPSSSTGNTSALADAINHTSSALQQQQQQQQQQLPASLMGSASAMQQPCSGQSCVASGANGKCGCSGAVGANNHLAGGRLMSHSIAGTTTTSSPVSSSCNSMNHAHSTHDARSIPHIGNVTWVLRHSISDPGNSFEHSPAFSHNSPNSRHHHHNHNHHHPLHNHHNQHHHHHHHHHASQLYHHHRHSEEHERATPSDSMSGRGCNGGGGGGGGGGEVVTASGDIGSSRPATNTHSECAQCESCAPSTSSYSAISLNNYCSAPAINKELPASSSSALLSGALLASSVSNEHKSPKLFYIDEPDTIPSGPAGAVSSGAYHSGSGPLLAPPSTPTAASNASANNTSSSSSSQMSSHLQSPLVGGLALGSAASTATCCSQPSTPAISTASSGECLRNSSSASAWSNAPNLASWIDNEVNSLVHDLEAESQQLSHKSENKKSKKKWLSVTSASIRRNSSGAQST